MTALHEGELRFIVKQQSGKPALWRIYDRERASYPYRTQELGEVSQDVETEKEAQKGADALNKAHPVKAVKSKKSKKKKEEKDVSSEDSVRGDSEDTEGEPVPESA